MSQFVLEMRPVHTDATSRKYVRWRRQINEWVQFDQSIVDAPIDLQWRHAAGR